MQYYFYLTVLKYSTDICIHYYNACCLIIYGFAMVIQGHWSTIGTLTAPCVYEFISCR